MKKTLLFGAAAMVALGVNALEPQIIPDVQMYVASPNGEYVAGEFYGVFGVLNTATGEYIELMDEDFLPGNGRSISKMGTICGNSEYEGPARLWKNGEIITLHCPNSELYNVANSITPDGRFIVGSVGNAKMTVEDIEIPMQIPAIWELLSDGTYSDAIILPYPVKDFTGRVPQYITAFSITDDGTTIFGQVRDYSGGFTQMVKYTRGEEGEWEYTLLASELLNPNGVEFPEWPGEGPVQPYYEDYMTNEEIAAYEAAIESYYEDLDPDAEYPNFKDFMSPVQKAAYEEAIEAYNVANDIFNEKLEEFFTAFEEATANSTSFLYNNMYLSADNKTLGTTSVKMEEVESPWWPGMMVPMEKYAPALYNVETDEFTFKSSAYDLMVSTAFNDGTLLCSKLDPEYYDFLNAYAWKANDEEPIDYVDYLASINPASAEFVKENCVHDVEGYAEDPDTGEWMEITIEDMMIIGVPCASADQSIFFNSCNDLWGDEAYIYSYVYEGIGTNRVAEAMASIFGVKALKGGKVLVSGDVESVLVSDINGRVVYNGKAQNGIINLGVNNGAYIVKAVAKDGSSKVLKAIF